MDQIYYCDKKVLTLIAMLHIKILKIALKKKLNRLTAVSFVIY